MSVAAGESRINNFKVKKKKTIIYSAQSFVSQKR